MISLFKRLFGSRGSNASSNPRVDMSAGIEAEAEAQASRFSDSRATVEDNSENGMRSQLVHVLLRDALRRHGLPPHWIACQILLVASRRRGPGMFVRLVVKHWDDRLIRHLLAFEKSFQADIERFEPLAKQWLHGISWQLEPLNVCPYPDMPDRTFWQDTPPVVAAARVRMPEPAPVAARAAPQKPVGGAGFQRAIPMPAVPAVPVVPALPAVPAAELTPDPAVSDIERIFAVRDREMAHSADFSATDYQKTEPSSLNRT